MADDTTPQPDAVEAMREAMEPFARLARWALEPHKSVNSNRKLVEAPGMLRDFPDDYLMRDQQLAPGEPRLHLGHFRALLAALVALPDPIADTRDAEKPNA